jgi:uncharacterized protein
MTSPKLPLALILLVLTLLIPSPGPSATQGLLDDPTPGLLTAIPSERTIASTDKQASPLLSPTFKFSPALLPAPLPDLTLAPGPTGNSIAPGPSLTPVTTDDEKLQNAIRIGETADVEDLLNQGVNVNTHGPYGLTPLIIAASHDHYDIAQLLIERGADLNLGDGMGWTPLMHAARKGGVELTRLLAEKGADVNARSRGDESALLVALTEGHVEVASLLMGLGANVNARDADGTTVLIWAVLKGNFETVELLLIKGAEVNARNSVGITALIAAAGLSGMEKRLQESNPGFQDTQGKFPNAGKAKPAIVKLLLDKGANANVRADNGFTALMVSVFSGETGIARLLIENGAAVNAGAKDGTTPLIIASIMGHIDMVKLLIDKGANVKEKNENGETPFRLAGQKGHREVAALLAQAGGEDRFTTTPILNHKQRLQFKGFSLLPPSSPNWYFLEQSDSQVVFGRATGDTSHTVRLYTELRKVYDPRFQKDLASLKQLAEQGWAFPGPRYQRVVTKISQDKCQGRDCVRYDFTCEDHAVPSAPGSVFTFTGYGFHVLHPDERETIVVSIHFSQRFPKGKKALAIESEVGPSIRSLTLTPMK